MDQDQEVLALECGQQLLGQGLEHLAERLLSTEGQRVERVGKPDSLPLCGLPSLLVSFLYGSWDLTFLDQVPVGLCFAIMEEFVTDPQYHQWNASGILNPNNSLEWVHSTQQVLRSDHDFDILRNPKVQYAGETMLTTASQIE